jgi:hypothetical protein
MTSAALVALFIALFVEHRKAPGERPMVLVISGSVDQAATVFSYIKGFIEYAPALMREAVSMTCHEIELKNGVVLAVHANSYRTVRGRTICACVFDEVSFWKDENSALPDIEMYRAVLPALINGGILVGIGTPYRKFGLLHQKWRDHFGHDGDNVLVMQGASQRFNETLRIFRVEARRLSRAFVDMSGGGSDGTVTAIAMSATSRAAGAARTTRTKPRRSSLRWPSRIAFTRFGAIITPRNGLPAPIASLVWNIANHRCRKAICIWKVCRCSDAA